MAVAAYTMAILTVRYEVRFSGRRLRDRGCHACSPSSSAFPTVRLRADYLAIATVAAGEIIRYLAMNLPDLTGGPVGSMAMLGPTKLASTMARWQTMVGAISRGVTSFLGVTPSRDAVMAAIVWVTARPAHRPYLALERSPWGRVQKAIREDEIAVAAVGKDVVGFKMQALVLGAVLGGLSGLLLAFQIESSAPTTFCHADLLRLFDPDPRRHQSLGHSGWRHRFSLLYSGTRFLNFLPFRCSSGSRAFLRLILVGALLVLFMACDPKGSWAIVAS